MGPDLDPNCLTLMILLKEFFEKVDLEKNQQKTEKLAKLPSRQTVKEDNNFTDPYVQAQ